MLDIGALFKVIFQALFSLSNYEWHYSEWSVKIKKNLLNFPKLTGNYPNQFGQKNQMNYTTYRYWLKCVSAIQMVNNYPSFHFDCVFCQ